MSTAAPDATRRVAALAVVSKAAGLIRTFVAARTLGTTAFADAYTAANAVPNVLVDVVANGVANGAVVPLQAASLAQDRRADADQAISAQLTWVALVTVPLMLAAILARHWISRLLLGSSHDPAQLAAAARMLVVLLLQIPLYGFGVVLSSALQARRLFMAPSLAPILSSAVVTLTYVLFALASRGRDIGSVSRASELLLVIGTSLGVVALTVPLFIPLRRSGWRWKPTLRVADGHSRALARLGAAGALALFAQQAATVITMRLASAEHGGVVIMNLTFTVLLLPLSLVAVPLATTSLPELAATHAVGDSQAFARTRSMLLRRTSSLGVLAGVGSVALAPVIAWVLLRSSPGDHGSVGLLARTIATSAPAAVAIVICHAASRVCFAVGHWRQAAVVASTGWLTAAASELVIVHIAHLERSFALSLCLTGGFLVAALIARIVAAQTR